MSSLSISGAISGLDTATIIDQLVAVDARQQTLLQNRQTAAQKTADAYSALISTMKAFSSQAASLAKTSTWSGTAATSSSSSVTVTTSGNTAAGAQLTFDVQKLAKAHSLVSTGSVSSDLDVVSSGGSVTISRSGQDDVVLDVGDGTLGEVAAAINAKSSTLGVRATVVQASAGQYRLQIGATKTGAGSEFSVSGIDGLGSLDVLSQAQDAQILVGGSSPAAYTATSTTNTFSTLVPGMAFTVSAETTNVTVEAHVDGTAVANSISALVTSANSILATIKSQTAYDTDSQTGGPLMGSSSVRLLQQSILSAVSGAGAPGVSVTRDGTITFDQSAFTKAYAADPTGTAGKFGASVSLTPATGVTNSSVTLLTSSTAARAGSVTLKVTSPAERESWRIDPAGASIADQTISWTRGDTTVTYTAGSGESLSDAATAMNTLLSEAGADVVVSADSTGLLFRARSTGSSGAFSVDLLDTNGDPTTTGTKLTAGADIAGTINGVAGIGLGDSLRTSTSATSLPGIAFKITTTADDIAANGGVLGTMTYSTGLAQSLALVATDATQTSTGWLTSAQKGMTDTVKDLQNQVDAWDRRLEARRLTLQKQFTLLETTLASLQSQTSALSGLSTSSSSSS